MSTVRFPVAKHQARRKGECPVCGKTVNRTRVFECTQNPFNTWPDGTPLTFLEVMAQAQVEAMQWEPDFTHAKCAEGRPVTAVDLSAIRAQLAGITPGLIEVVPISSTRDVYGLRIAGKQGYAELKKRDATFFAAAPSMVAGLLAVIERVEALHKPEKRWMPYDGADISFDTRLEAALYADGDDQSGAGVTFFEVCTHCKTIEDGPCEGECTKEAGYRESLWPCKTIEAIAGEGGE